MNLTFLQETLRSYLGRIENELRRKLLPRIGRSANRYTIAFDEAELLRVDFETQMKGYQNGVYAGWMSRNEVRKAIGMNPGPSHLDTYMVPVNMQDSERLLDTESLQDQPIGGPIATPADGKPTTLERNRYKGYRKAYHKLYEDAVTRLCKRSVDKRDLQAVSTVFSPLLESMAELSSMEARHIAASSDRQFDPSKAVNANLKALSERSAKWTAY
jgi:Phage portal protein